jgi:phosphoribosylaminoimidazolecarboxamide formyltransferase/IMP cyclohydrolase
MASMKRALISVSDKTGVVDMAQGLTALGAETRDRLKFLTVA